jgi:hypothetical protein
MVDPERFEDGTRARYRRSGEAEPSRRAADVSDVTALIGWATWPEVPRLAGWCP